MCGDILYNSYFLNSRKNVRTFWEVRRHGQGKMSGRFVHIVRTFIAQNTDNHSNSSLSYETENDESMDDCGSHFGRRKGNELAIVQTTHNLTEEEKGDESWREVAKHTSVGKSKVGRCHKSSRKITIDI